MASLTGFVGPSSPSISRNINSERCVNRYVEVSDSGTPKVRASLLQTPGVRPWCFLGSGPVRALFIEPSYQRLFAVAGAILWEIFPSQTAVARGTVALDGNPATICSNGTAGHQLFCVSGGLGYIFDLNINSFQQITAAGFPNPCLMGGICNELFLALKSDSNEWHWSNLLDGTLWDNLDVAQIQSQNNILALVVDHLEVWLLGQQVTEVWQNVGSGNTIFQPISGTPIQRGIFGSWAWGHADNTLFWGGAGVNGGAQVFRANGYTPQRVSNHAVEQVFQSLPRVSDTIIFTYQQNGHEFVWLYLPEAETSWVYDVSSNLWHERALWNPRTMRFEPHLGRCHAYAYGKTLIGDRISGAIYELGTDIYTDAIVMP